jgi:hypothetical protein
MVVLRGGPGNPHSDVALHNQTKQVTFGKLFGPWGPLFCICIAHLCLSDYPPTPSFGGFGRVRVFSFDQCYIFYYS